MAVSTDSPQLGRQKYPSTPTRIETAPSIKRTEPGTVRSKTYDYPSRVAYRVLTPLPGVQTTETVHRGQNSSRQRPSKDVGQGLGSVPNGHSEGKFVLDCSAESISGRPECKNSNDKRHSPYQDEVIKATPGLRGKCDELWPIVDDADRAHKKGPSKNPTRNRMTMKPAPLVHKGMQMVGILQRILSEKRRVRMRAMVHAV